jgi:nitrous oxidase accessory protein NosD
LNNQRGMNFWSGSNNIVSWNEVRNNTQDGVRINSVFNNNRIWNNTFIGNNGAGSVYDPAHIQAYDGGTNTRWNTSGTTHGYGNYWRDWTTPDANFDGIVDKTYNLTAGIGPMDYYPLTTPALPIPEFSEMIVPIVGLIMIALIFGRARKEP